MIGIVFGAINDRCGGRIAAIPRSWQLRANSVDAKNLPIFTHSAKAAATPKRLYFDWRGPPISR